MSRTLAEEQEELRRATRQLGLAIWSVYEPWLLAVIRWVEGRKTRK